MIPLYEGNYSTECEKKQILQHDNTITTDQSTLLFQSGSHKG